MTNNLIEYENKNILNKKECQVKFVAMYVFGQNNLC